MVRAKLLVTISVALAILTSVMVYHKQPEKAVPVVSKPIPVNVEHSPKLASEAKRLGLDITNVNVTYKKNLNYGGVTSGATIYGFYQPPNTIYIRPDKPANERRVLAHEYMHYVYAQKLSDADKELWSQIYEQYQSKDPYIKRQLTFYTNCDELCKLDESHSMSCVEILPTTLQAKVNAYCDRFIPSRQLLF